MNQMICYVTTWLVSKPLLVNYVITLMIWYEFVNRIMHLCITKSLKCTVCVLVIYCTEI